MYINGGTFVWVHIQEKKKGGDSEGHRVSDAYYVLLTWIDCTEQKKNPISNNDQSHHREISSFHFLKQTGR